MFIALGLLAAFVVLGLEFTFFCALVLGARADDLNDQLYEKMLCEKVA
jgi:hypothetical protein